MAADSSTPNGAKPDSPLTGNQSARSWKGKLPKRPLTFWLVLSAAAIGGLTLSTLMVLGAIVASHAKQEGFAVAFGLTAGACVVLPVMIVWATMEKMLKIAGEDNADD